MLSLVWFNPVGIAPETPVGLYYCTRLRVYYPDGRRGITPTRGDDLPVPNDLRFRVVEEPKEIPQIERYGCVDPHEGAPAGGEEGPPEYFLV